jgi:RecA/RadA recombinase
MAKKKKADEEEVKVKKAKKGTKVKKAPKAKKSKSDEIVAFNPYAHLDSEIDGMEKKFKLSAMSLDKDEPRFSTGLLSLDILLAGGLLGGGWYTCFGGEQSCKSTTAMTILSSIMSQKSFIGKASYWDYEGSTQAEYIENIMGSMGIKENVENVFGVRDDETGEWLVQPRVRYYTPDTGERFFNYVAKLEKILPDKIKENGNWWFVFENTKENQKALKGQYNKEMFSKRNKFYVPAPDGSIQAIVLCDSYPAMLPAIADEKEEGDKSLALQARMFSDGIKRIKANLRRKKIIILGINQLRKIPMAMYGPTEQEPCGEALRFYSDVRLRMASCALSAAGAKGKGVIEEEESVVSDGEDKYRYIKIRTYKNKLGGIPNQEIICRLVVEDAEGNATGFCRTWDAYQYLKLTGQITGTRKKLKFAESFDYPKKDHKTGKEEIHTHAFKSPLGGMTLGWMDFKVLTQGSRDEIKELCRKLGLKKPIIFRTFLEKQIAEGKGYRYMQDWKRSKSASKRSKAAADFDEDDDE